MDCPTTCLMGLGYLRYIWAEGMGWPGLDEERIPFSGTTLSALRTYVSSDTRLDFVCATGVVVNVKGPY